MPVPNNSDSSSDSSVIIGGALGGVILILMIIVVIFAVIICMKCNGDKKSPVNSKVTYNPTMDVVIEFNSLYDVTEVDNKVIKQEDLETSNNKKINKERCIYAQPNVFNEHTDLDVSVNMCVNPSYRVNVGEDKEVPFSLTEAKSNEKPHQSSTKQCNHDYVHNSSGQLQHNTVASATDDAEKNCLQAAANSHYANVSQYVINQLKSDENAIYGSQ